MPFDYDDETRDVVLRRDTDDSRSTDEYRDYVTGSF